MINKIKNKVSSFKNILKNDEISDFRNKIKNIVWASILWISTIVAPLNSANAAPTITWIETGYDYPHISTSIDQIWIENVREFMKYFWIEKWNDEKFALKVLEIQKQAWFKEDWILWNKTFDFFQDNLKSSKVKEISNYKNNNLNHKENYSKSINFIWINEVSNFVDFFWISSHEDFSNKVYSIQKDNSLEADWIIWSETLEVLYEKYYLGSKMTQEIRHRKETYSFMNNYPNPKNYKLHKVFNPVTNFDYYYWPDSGLNMKNTFINEKLYNLNKKWNISIEPDFNDWNSIQIWKLADWKYFIAVFKDSDLKVLSYTTPWREGKKSPENTVEKVDFVSKGYISSSYPRRSDWNNWGSVMPYAVEVDAWDGIYIHARMLAETWTYWCFWVPMFYQKAIYDLVNKSWKQNYKIKIWKLYK